MGKAKFYNDKGSPKKIVFGDKHSGIQIEYVKSKKRFDIFGWFDEYAGIEGGSISLDEFKEFFGLK